MGKSDDVLGTFGQCTRDLIQLLHDNTRLARVEQMFIESHLALIRSAYDGWKRRNTPSLK